MPQFRVQFRVKCNEHSGVRSIAAGAEQLVEAKDENEAIGLGWLAVTQDMPAELRRLYRWQMIMFGRVIMDVLVGPELPTIDSKADVA